MQKETQVPERFGSADWDEVARWTMVCAIDDLKAALNVLIPIPRIHTHNVALALDELIREAEAALAEMP